MLKNLFRWTPSRRAVPKKWSARYIVDLPLLAVDLELNSLDVNSAEVLSVGWIASEEKQIKLAAGHHVLGCCTASLNQSPTIHGLTVEALAQGNDLTPTFIELAAKADSHVWVLHNADLDLTVLGRQWKKLGLRPNVWCIDTLQLRLYELRKHYDAVPPGSVSLSASCDAHSLPAFVAHNALDDAHASLLLLFAQLYRLDPKHNLRMDDIRHTGASRPFYF